MLTYQNPSGQALRGGIDPLAAIDPTSPIHSTAGSLLLSLREGDGTRGWAEATCGDE